MKRIIQSVCIICSLDFECESNSSSKVSDEGFSNLLNRMWSVFCSYLNVTMSQQGILNHYNQVKELPFCTNCRNDVASLLICHDQLQSCLHKVQVIKTKISDKIVHLPSTNLTNNKHSKSKYSKFKNTNSYQVICDDSINRQIHQLRQEIAKCCKEKSKIEETSNNDFSKALMIYTNSKSSSTSSDNTIEENESTSSPPLKSAIGPEINSQRSRGVVVFAGTTHAQSSSSSSSNPNPEISFSEGNSSQIVEEEQEMEIPGTFDTTSNNVYDDPISIKQERIFHVGNFAYVQIEADDEGDESFSCISCSAVEKFHDDMISHIYLHHEAVRTADTHHSSSVGQATTSRLKDKLKNKRKSTLPSGQSKRKLGSDDSVERKHVCMYCSKRFKSRSHLTCHHRVHTGERPYKCRYCPKTFQQVGPRTIHERRHTDERPYTCHECSASFISAGSLRHHEINKKCLGLRQLP